MFSTSLPYSLPRIMAAATHITSVRSWPVVTRHSKGLNPRFYPAPTIGYPLLLGLSPAYCPGVCVTFIYARTRCFVPRLVPHHTSMVFSLLCGILREVVLFNEGRYKGLYCIE